MMFMLTINFEKIVAVDSLVGLLFLSYRLWRLGSSSEIDETKHKII